MSWKLLGSFSLFLVSFYLSGQQIISGSQGGGNRPIAIPLNPSPPNQLPSVSLTSPQDGDTLYKDQSYTATASASDEDGSVAFVSFDVNDEVVQVDSSSPYNWTVDLSSTGSFEILPFAVDNDGATGTGDPITYYIVDTVTITQGTASLVEAEDMTYSASLRTNSIFSNDTAIILNSSSTLTHTLPHDVDSLILQIYAQRDDAIFDVLINDVVVGTDTTKTLGFSEYSFLVSGTTGQSYEVQMDAWYMDKDYTVFFDNYPPGEPLPDEPGDGGGGGEDPDPDPGDVQANYSLPENEDYDYFISVVPDSVTSLKDTLSADKFYISNDSLYSFYSFNHEYANQYYICFETTNGLSVNEVSITDVTGKFDENGFADADVAAKYDHVDEGDWIFWNANNGSPTRNINTQFDQTFATVNPSNKILIHAGKYGFIRLYSNGQLAGNNTKDPIVITNFLGQVVHDDGFSLKDSAIYVRITGQYDAANGYGHRHFVGCDKNGSTVDFTHAQGTFGIRGIDNWESERTGHAYSVDGGNSYGIEIDHTEAGDGYFSGWNWKFNDNFGITDSNSFHHNYGHDIGSEGLYQGSTTVNSAQQLFKNFRAYNNVMVRIGGEGIQTGRLLGGARIKNNISHAGLDWKNPFQRFQDGNFQMGNNGGKNIVRDNIFLGAGESGSYIANQDEPEEGSISGVKAGGENWPKDVTHPIDTVFFVNNLYNYVKGPLVVYSPTIDDGKTSLVVDSNYFGPQYYFPWEVYNKYSADDDVYVIALENPQPDGDVYTLARNNSFHTGITAFSRNNNPTLTNNVQETVVNPDFRKYLDTAYTTLDDTIVFGDDFNYFQLERYTDLIGTEGTFVSGDNEVPGGISRNEEPAWWEPDDIVQYWNENNKTRFYICVQADSVAGNDPSQDDLNPNNAYWKQLYWLKEDGSKSYYPPDDVRLETGSFYEQKGMGLKE